MRQLIVYNSVYQWFLLYLEIGYPQLKPQIMNCVINNVINSYHKKGKKVEVIRRYIRMKYHITMDIASIRERIRSMNMDYKFT